MKPRKLLFLILLGLALGFLAGWKHVASPESTATAAENPALATQREKLRQLEQDLTAARNAASMQPMPPTPAEAPPMPTPPPQSSAAPREAEERSVGRLAAFESLKDQGAAIRVGIFGGRSPTSLNAIGKKFFNLTDDEAAKVETIIANARRDVDQVGTDKGTITAATADSITVTVPPGDNAKDIRARTAAELAAAVGPDRAQEIMEIAAPELDRVLRSFASQERTLVVTRVIPPPNAPALAQNRFRLSERYPNGSEGIAFNTPAEKEGFTWLSKFTPELESLIPAGR